MIGFNLFKASPVILEKINFLFVLLQQGKKEYEQVAINISDKELRRTVLSLAQENNQYSCELSSQIESLGAFHQKKMQMNLNMATLPAFLKMIMRYLHFAK